MFQMWIASYGRMFAARESYQAGGWWLDPKVKDFGANAKYFQFNLEEAKKLLAAAGHPKGFDVTFHYPATPQYNLVNDSEPITGFWQALGVNVKVNPHTDYTNDYIPNNRDASGAFEGIANHSVTGTTPSVVSPVSALLAEYWPKSGITFHGFDVNGRGDKSGDPQLNTMLEKMRLEKDTNAAKKLAHDVQRHLAKTQASMIFPGCATGFWHFSSHWAPSTHSPPVSLVNPSCAGSRSDRASTPTPTRCSTARSTSHSIFSFSSGITFTRTPPMPPSCNGNMTP